MSKNLTDQMRRQNKQHEADRRAWHAEREKLEQRTHTGVAKLVWDWPDLPDLFQALTELHEATVPGNAAKTDSTRSKSHEYISDDGRTLKEGASTARARGMKGQATKQLQGLIGRLENLNDPNRIKENKPRCGREGCSGRWKRQPYGVKVCGFCTLPMPGHTPPAEKPRDSRPASRGKNKTPGST